jgi:Ser/Thr protein kinase RdoA (MazF antagonist)
LTRPLAEIVRAFGVEPDAIRRVSHRQNTHWRVRAGDHRYALRRCGAWLDVEGDLDWELAVVEQWANAGLPIARPVGPSRAFNGARWILMPWLGGRKLGREPWTDDDYEQLGEYLADLHTATAGLSPPPNQRPGWTSYMDAAFPLTGGAARRAQLLAALAKVDAGVAAQFQAAAEALEARELPKLFANQPRRTIHADFSPWNIRLRGGRMIGFFDFELAHVDVLIGDIAQSRRGFHDGVVRGYLRHASLSNLELANLDAFWLAAVMMGVWRELEMRLAKGAIAEVGFEWTLAQLGKIRPYQS